jgi:hypothetical protein
MEPKIVLHDALQTSLFQGELDPVENFLRNSACSRPCLNPSLTSIKTTFRLHPGNLAGSTASQIEASTNE